MKLAISIHRLEDAHKREARPDGKRVYKLVIGKKELILVLYQNFSQNTRNHYERNIKHYQLLYENKINPLALLFHNDDEMTFIAEYGGERLDDFLRVKRSETELRDVVKQAVRIIGDWNRLNLEKKPFVLPRPLERFFDAWRENRFSSLKEDIYGQLLELYQELLELTQSLNRKDYNYGYGRIDGDIINFAIKNGRVSTFDFDGTYDFYDIYYVLSYLWVSLERVGPQAKKLREYLFGEVDFKREDAALRFFLGGAGAYLIEVCAHPVKEVVRARLEHIQGLKTKLHV